MSETAGTCPDCGLTLERLDGPTHAYIGGSPSCWAMFGEVLAREYSDAVYMKAHQLTVDTYAVQHPGRPEPRAIRSVWGHLASLYWQVGKDAPADIGRRAIPVVAAIGDELGWLTPPSEPAGMTIRDVFLAADAAEHRKTVRRWAESVWQSWSEHHDRIAAVAERATGA